MAFLSEVARKAGDVMQGVQKSGERVRLQRLIEQKQRQFDELFAQIGRIYYQARGQGSAPGASADELCNAADALSNELERLRRREDMLANVRRCASCGALQPLDAKFCGSCGEKLQATPTSGEDARDAQEAREKAPEERKEQPAQAEAGEAGAHAAGEGAKSVFINWPDEKKPEAQEQGPQPE